MHKVKIKQVSHTQVKVWLDDMEITGLYSVEYTAAVQESPRITLSLYTNGEPEIEPI